MSLTGSCLHGYPVTEATGSMTPLMPVSGQPVKIAPVGVDSKVTRPERSQVSSRDRLSKAIVRFPSAPKGRAATPRNAAKEFTRVRDEQIIVLERLLFNLPHMSQPVDTLASKEEVLMTDGRVCSTLVVEQ